MPVEPSKVNPTTVEAHKALQAGLVPLGKAHQQGNSPAQLRDIAAAKGLLVEDPLRVLAPHAKLSQSQNQVCIIWCFATTAQETRGWRNVYGELQGALHGTAWL